MSEYRLRTDEVMLAAIAGVMRQIENLKNGRRDALGADARHGWQYHVEGCIGEWVLARHLSVAWHGKGSFRGADVGVSEQVRTRPPHTPLFLLLHPGDLDDARYWLICGEGLVYRVQGWIT